ncbi:MAG: hypothetical protein R3266_03195 [Gemmatimonadota bacterium]|nr:hypothetical protein [Gemmatimonadota bacterium]
MEKPKHADRATGDTLEELLEVEARLEERLQECMAEAEAIVEEARVAAARRERDVEREIREARADELRAREIGLAEAVREERDRAAHAIRALRGLSSEQLDVMAHEVIGRVLDDAGS